MRKNAAAEAPRSDAPKRERRTSGIDRKPEARKAPEMSPADSFTADAKEYVRLLERRNKIGSEIGKVRDAGLALSAVEKSVSEAELPKIDAAIERVRAKYGPLADRFAEDAQRIAETERAAKKLDKKDQVLVREQVNDLVGEFLVAARKARSEPAPKSNVRKLARKPKTKAENYTGDEIAKDTRIAADKETSSSALADTLSELETATARGKADLAEMTDQDIDAAVGRLKEQDETSDAITETLRTIESMPTDPRADLAKMTDQDIDAAVGKLEEQKDTPEAMAETLRTIESMPEPGSPRADLAKMTDQDIDAAVGKLDEQKETEDAVADALRTIESMPDRPAPAPERRRRDTMIPGATEQAEAEAKTEIPPASKPLSYRSAILEAPARPPQEGETLPPPLPDLAAMERRIQKKFGIDAKAVVAEQNKGFWRRMAQNAKLLMKDVDLMAEIDKYRAAIEEHRNSDDVDTYRP